MALGAFFRDGNDGRIAINGGRAGEDDVLAAVLAHHIEEDEGAVHIVFVVFERLHAAFAHGLESGEVDAGVKLMLIEHLLQAFAVADIYFVERHFLADDFLHALEGDGAAVVKVVNYYGLMSGLCEFNQGVAADESGTTSQENLHGIRVK